MLDAFGPRLYSAEGPTVSFYGFPYPTRMAVAQLSDGSAWVWSPVSLTDALARAVDAIGPVRHIVSPNKLHHLFLRQWSERWPEARVHAPPGLARKVPGLRIDATLGDAADPAWAGDIDQVVFGGSFAMAEVAFFHRASGTAIFGDLIQRFPETWVGGWKRTLLRWGGLLGDSGGTPPDWRSTFLRRGRARAARERVLAWKPTRLLIAHGNCAQAGAAAIIADALRWM
jgi:hypothetical protein